MKNLQYCLVEKNLSLEQILKEMKQKGLPITFISSKKIKDYREIEIAAYLTKNSFISNPISKKIENEFLIQISGERQISKAIEKLGPTTDEDFIVVYFGEENLSNILKDYGINIKKEFNNKIEDKKLFDILEKKTIGLIKE